MYFFQLSGVNNRPIGKKSPNLVTLPGTPFSTEVAAENLGCTQGDQIGRIFYH
jgi:hypothetical protein